MSTYHPPFARMRQIKRDTPPRSPRDMAPVEVPAPANVTEALAVTPEAVYVIEEPEIIEKTLELPVVTVEEPIVLDETDIEDVASSTPPPVPEPPPVTAPQAPEPPKYHPQMKKGELVMVAANMGVAVTDEMTKAQILDALKATGR